MSTNDKARKRTVRDMRRWTRDMVFEGREIDPSRPALAIAISSELDYAYLLHSKPLSVRGARKWEGTFNDHEEMLGRIAKGVWDEDASTIVHLSHWPAEGDFGTMELDGPGQSKGSSTDPDQHWRMNLMCLTGKIFPVDENGRPFDRETLSAMAERQRALVVS